MSTNTAFERRGAGPALLLVHGLGSRRKAFEPIIDALAETHDVVAGDLPGFGRSPMVPGVTPGPVGYARWLTRFIEEIGIERLHVVGNSMGGAVALELGRLGVASRVTAFSPVGFWQQQQPNALGEIPVTVARGAADAVLSHRTQGRRAKTLLPTARHIRLPDCGHLPFFGDPDLCACLLADGPGGWSQAKEEG